jgi:hypothetical protein
VKASTAKRSGEVSVVGSIKYSSKIGEIIPYNRRSALSKRAKKIVANPKDENCQDLKISRIISTHIPIDINNGLANVG